MERVARTLDVGAGGAVAAIQDVLWRLMEKDVVQALLVPLQTHPREVPAPTLIKNRERLLKTNPLAPVMPINSAKIVAMLLAQEPLQDATQPLQDATQPLQDATQSWQDLPPLQEAHLSQDTLQLHKRLAAVMRACEVRALTQQRGSALDNLITVSVDCLDRHEQSAPHHFRRACQVCVQPHYDQADLTIGLFGQNVDENVLIFADADLAERMGLLAASPDGGAWTRPAAQAALESRRQAIEDLATQRHAARQRLLDEIQSKTTDLADLLALFDSCMLCGQCQDACPLALAFDVDAYEDNTPGYVAARVLDLARRAESCVACGMCEVACRLGIPLMSLVRLFAERAQVGQDLVAALAERSA